MFISKQLKENNIAEYLIYMWQVEDMIRANGCDMEKIKKNIVLPSDGRTESRIDTMVYRPD